MNELRTHKDTFHWLYSLSFDWSLLVPFLPSIRERMQLTGVEGRIRAAFDLTQPETLAPSTSTSNSTLKIRLLEAIIRLAADIDVPLTKIGHLYDRTLTTGTHMGIAEFLVLSEHEASRLRDLEKSLQSCTPGDHTGLMLFFVRELPSTPVFSRRRPGAQVRAERISASVYASLPRCACGGHECITEGR